MEKPPSHNCWEGRKMIEAARKYKRIVQVGTQNRSAAYCMAARKYIADGKLGKVHFCRIYNQKDWANFPMSPDSDPPAGFDWDRWNGPAPEAKYNSTLPCELASLLALLQRRHHQRRHPPDRPGALRPGRRLSRHRSTRPAPASNRERPNRPTRRWPCTTSTTWWSRFELTLYTPYMLKISPLIRQATDKFPTGRNVPRASRSTAAKA